MSTKRPTKPAWLAEREPYTWHLRPPFEDEFDRSQWWKNEPFIDPVAAVYELTRRHPLVGSVRQLENWSPFKGFNQVWASLIFGLKAWPNLDSNEQSFWSSYAGNMKGIDCRDSTERCYSIQDSVSTQLALKRAFTKKELKHMTIDKLDSPLWKEMAKHPPSTVEMESEIKRLSVTAYRNGFMLMAIAPDLHKKNAAKLMKKEYKQHLIATQEHKQRLKKPKNWLALISEFEDAVIGPNGAKSPLFNRYRHMINSIPLL
jgi:hypothetical protein